MTLHSEHMSYSICNLYDVIIYNVSIIKEKSTWKSKEKYISMQTKRQIQFSYTKTIILKLQHCCTVCVKP